MKNQENKSGYVKVSIELMCTELLHSTHDQKLLLTHKTELNRINLRNNRIGYVSKAQRNYLTTLYTDVVLNNKSFQNKKIISENKKVNFKHIGMQMLFAQTV